MTSLNRKSDAGMRFPKANPGDDLDVRRATTLLGVKEGLTVGPDEILVILVEPGWSHEQAFAMRDRLLDVLRPDQFVIIAGNATMAKAEKPPGKRIPGQDLEYIDE